jgi:hypothetical protein
MFQRNASSEKQRNWPCDRPLGPSFRFPVASALGAFALALCSPAVPASAATQPEEPFKFANIHFETNASACDMGIQILFDTDGVTEGSVEDPNEQLVYSFQTAVVMEETHDQTEGFQERVEPPIMDLEDALGCEPSTDAITLEHLLTAWPAGRYEFEGQSGGVEFEGIATLSHKVPAGPVITAPEDGSIVPHDQPLVIRWKKVTGPLIPKLGPVQVVGYHVVVKDLSEPAAPGRVPAQLDGDVSENETSFTVPKQYLEPGKIYEFEVLATERGNNQTITEGGAFCTPPLTAEQCVIE